MFYDLFALEDDCKETNPEELKNGPTYLMAEIHMMIEYILYCHISPVVEFSNGEFLLFLL